MKKLLVSFAVTAYAASAMAGDLPLKAPIYQAPAAMPAWSWTGFYVGGHIGGALETSNFSDPFGAVPFGDNVRSPAFIGGGQIGGNYQIGKLVFGAEADFSWANSSGDNTCFGIPGIPFSASNCGVAPDMFGTVTGRLGYAFGRTLVYVKGGAAWEHNNVNMIVNENQGGHLLTSASDYAAWGWTVGGGVEYGLTPAWSLKLEYDYFGGFGSSNVATPYVPGNPLVGHPVGPIAGLSDTIQQVKLGINYRLGADPWSAGISAQPVPSFLPLKAPPPVAASSGWEVEAGARYMYSWGRDQWDLGGSTRRPATTLNSRLTWDNMMSNSAELYGRVDTPSNVFVSGFIGTGDTVSGGQNDEDFDVGGRYNNTFSTNHGSINYAVADIGYDALRSADYKVGPFVGYTLFNEYIFKYSCLQIANPLGNCTMPLPSSRTQLIGSEDMTWQGVRVGLSGQVALADRWKLTADVAYLPYVTVNWLDDHLERDLQVQMLGHGVGVQTQAVLTYDITDRLNVGIGARYWAMWTNVATAGFIPGSIQPNRNAIELAGTFVQLGYKFYPGGGPASATSGAFAGLPILKAPVAVLPRSWTGLYVGVEGGGVWGDSEQIGQTTATGRPTSPATSWYRVSGGLAGVTVGYNSQFDRKFVFGMEADMSWMNASGSANQIEPFNRSQTASTAEHWLGTARARIGVTPVARWLVYATGGVAVADIEASIANANGSTAFSGESHVRPGWTAGGGVELSIIDNWSAKLEYLYVELEDHGYFVPTPNNPAITNRAGGVPLNNNIVRGGINYKIDWL
jgi:opacity protein-like surface antigen